MEPILSDFPKVSCPFIRQTFKVSHDDWKKHGSKLKLRTPEAYLVVNQKIMSGKTFIIEGIFQAMGKSYIKPDGEQVGEVIGPKLQGNPYKLDMHLWVPFERAITDLRYKSFHEHERTFENWSSWFRTGLVSRFYAKRASKLGLADTVMAEGIIFYNLKRRAENKTWMAKLRRDMFNWYYTDTIAIQDYAIDGLG